MPELSEPSCWVPGFLHESYSTQQNLDTELFWDEDTQKAAVCILQEGVCYSWELDGPPDLETVREFAETIIEIPEG